MPEIEEQTTEKVVEEKVSWNLSKSEYDKLMERLDQISQAVQPPPIPETPAPEIPATEPETLVIETPPPPPEEPGRKSRKRRLELKRRK